MSPRARASQKHSPVRDTIITGSDNQWLKRLRAALSGERAEGWVGVEGVRVVEAALGSGLPVEALLVSESGERHLARLLRSIPRELQILRTSDRLFAGISDTKSPQGVAMLVRPPRPALEELLRGMALVVVLVGVQDPGNVGTILRAAEAMGATGAATCPAGSIGTADPFGAKALRASAGSALRLPVVHELAAAAVVEKFRAEGVKIYAAVSDEAEPRRQLPRKLPRSDSPRVKPWEVDWKSPSALLIGNEGAGLPDEIVELADALVSIPQARATTTVGLESLNAAMAATVLLYEAMRQRGASGDDS